MRFRQVHLDFHTSGKIDGIGERFDKRQFQAALRAGHVDSVTVFSKCHHGYAYHPSEANTMHPGLKFDLLKAQIDAAHEIGVKTPVYLSAGIDEKIAREHTNWLVRHKDETTMWVPSFDVAGFHKFCMNTPYLDILCKQIEEVCERYDADGIFLDIVGPQPCYCQYCIKERAEMGVDAYDEREVIKHAERVYFRYAAATRAAVDKYKPGLPLFQNGGHIRQGRRDLASCNTHLEIESLPTGGWGYDHFPASARYAQVIGMEYLGMTGKFHTTWGEFGGFKHPNALRYEVALSAANGAKCSVGDQLAPSGEMDTVTYELIGSAYKELEKKEPWLDDVKSVSDIGIISAEAYSGSFGTAQTAKVGTSDSGAVRIMLEGKYLFDLIDFETDFDKYKVIILPDVLAARAGFSEKIKEYCKRGGKILATGISAINTECGEFDVDLGAKYIEKGFYNPCYARPSAQIPGMGDTGYVIYGKAEKAECTGTELLKIERPYFNRARDHFCSHRHTPNSGEYYSAGVTEGKCGIYIAWNIFDDYATNACISSKQIVCFALDRLLGKSKTLVTDLPAQGVATLMEQKGRLINHLLYAAPVRRGNGIEVIEDIIPIYSCKSSVKTDRAPRRVYLAPQCEDIEFTYSEGRVGYTVPKIDNHQMVVIEF